MGYPETPFQFSLSRLFLGASLVLLLSLCFPSLEGIAAPLPPRSGLPPGAWDHLIITDQSLMRSFTPLADHRQSQGFHSRILTTREILQWSFQTNLRDAIRGFIYDAHQEWGTQYVLLGGDAEFIPVPLGLFETPYFTWDVPLDIYYAAPHGEWDLDGDGILGEIGDDDPDLTPEVALGRAPVSDPAEVRSFVDKVIAFETQDAFDTRDVLLAAEVGSPYPWAPGMDIQYDFASNMEDVLDVLESLEFFGAFQRYYQNWEGWPGALPLSPADFLEALNNGDHRFLGMLTHGLVDTWSLGPGYLRSEDLGALEGMDHSLFMVPGVPQATDCRGQGVLKKMLVIPQGGCVGAMGPSAMFYVGPGDLFFRSFWQTIVDSPYQRIGDTYRQTMEDLLGIIPPGSLQLGTVMCMSIYGDPALSLIPVVGNGNGETSRVETALRACASPNPFNPATEISFDLPGTPGSKLSTVVDIYDLGGRRLIRILEDELEPGPHAIRWRGENASGKSVGSGLFFGRIQAGKHQAVVKLILVE